MKTTVEVSESLFRAAKALAARRGVTLRALIEEGLRHVVEGEESRAFKLRDASFDGRGLNPEFAEAGWEEIRRAAYSGRGT